MLIRFFLLLVAANLAWFFWAHSERGGMSQAEPERLAQQMHPEVVQLQEAPPPGSTSGEGASPSEAPPAPPTAVIITHPAPEAAPAPTIVEPQDSLASKPEPKPEAKPETKAEPKPRSVCLQAGAFNERQIEALRQRAAALPAGSWNVQEVSLPDRWMIFVSAPDELAAFARRAELRAQGIDTDRPGQGHGTGLSLGRYSSEERARLGLAQLAARGVRDARIIPERQSARAWTLRLPAATPELRERAQRTLGDALAGHTLQECSSGN